MLKQFHILNSVRFNTLCNFFISSAGTLLPAAIPVRRCSKPSYFTVPFWRSSSSAANMVGTPWRAVHFSDWTEVRVRYGSKDSLGKTIEAPVYVSLWAMGCLGLGMERGETYRA